MKEQIILEVFAKRFSELVKNSPIDISEIAEMLGLKSKSTIYRYMNAEMTPKIPMIKYASEIFNVNPLWLMGLDVPKYNSSNNFNSNYFEFKAEDDAMFPLLDIGDTASVYKQNTFDKDATYLIKLNNKKTIRRIEESKDKEYYELRAMNPLYKTEKLSKKDFSKLEILGKVIKTENYSAFK